MSSISCIIVEDQAPARRLIEDYVARTPDLTLLRSFDTASGALAALQSEPVDVVFLDLSIPGEFGFDLIRSLERRPRVVVTTAHPEHAVEGFALEVDDYLVKPIAYTRFLQAVNRLRAAFELERTGHADRIITAKRNGERVFLRLTQIHRIEAVRDHTQVVTDDGVLVFSKPLRQWLGELPPDQFIQTHKSHVVNLNNVRRVTFHAVRTGRGEVPIGRAFRPALMARLAEREAGA